MLLALAMLAALLPLAAPAEAQSPNNAPTVANEIPDQTATVGTAFSYAFPADTFDDADGDALTYTATKNDDTALPSWLTFTAGTRAFSGTPQLVDVETVSVKVTASDGTDSVSDTFEITVSGPLLVSNTGQTQNSTSPFSVKRAQPFTTGPSPAGYTLTTVSFPVTGNAPSTLVVRIAPASRDGKPGSWVAQLTLTQNGSTVTGTSTGVDLDANTTYYVLLTGTNANDDNQYHRTNSDNEDANSLSGWSIGDTSLFGDSFDKESSTSWQIAIGGSRPPNEIPDQTVPVGAFSYTFPANTFTDAAVDTLTYTATKADGTALPSWMTFTPSTRTFTGTPQLSDAGTVSVKVTASDGTASVSDTFDITVTETLVSNTGQTLNDKSHFGFDRAQSFRTGGNAAGYTLTGVSFPITGTAPLGSMSMRIERSSSSRPGGSLGSLTLSQSGTTVTGTSPGIGLAANTTYFVVMTGTNFNDDDEYHRTHLNSEDPGGAAGWSIGNESLWATDDFDQPDETSSSAWSWQLAITGSAKSVSSAPTLANPIPDQIAPVEAFSYSFPENTFTDEDGDVLTYTATKSDGTALPSWLTFTAETRTFWGAPQVSDAGTVSVTVTASDGTASVSDTFDITVDISAVAPVTETLVSNTGQTLNGKSHFGFDRAQSFRTGGNAAGYTLTGVSFPITGTAPLSWMSMRIERSSNGQPGGSLGSLTLSQSGTTVTGTSPGIHLAPDTTYFVVMTGTNFNSDDEYHRTHLNSEDPGGAAGWSIGNESLLSTDDFDQPDETSSSAWSWQLAITGSAKKAVQLAEAAYANGRTTLTLTFYRDLAAVAAPEPWDLRTAFSADGLWRDGRRYINLVPNLIETDGQTLTLTYNDLEALPGRELSVRYRGAHATRHLPTQLQYADGKKVASFTVTATRSAIGPVAPALTEAQVAGNVLTLTFDRALDVSSAPAGRRFKVNHIQQDWEGPSRVVAGTGTATVSGSTVTVTLAEPVPQDRFATVTYRKGDDANPLQADSSGPEVGDISWSLAAVLDRDAPRQTGALLAGTSLVLYYAEQLDTASTPATSSYAVATAGNNPQGVTRELRVYPSPRGRADPGIRAGGRRDRDLRDARTEPGPGRGGQRRGQPDGNQGHQAGNGSGRAGLRPRVGRRRSPDGVVHPEPRPGARAGRVGLHAVAEQGGPGGGRPHGPDGHRRRRARLGRGADHEPVVESLRRPVDGRLRQTDRCRRQAAKQLGQRSGCVHPHGGQLRDEQVRLHGRRGLRAGGRPGGVGGTDRAEPEGRASGRVRRLRAGAPLLPGAGRRLATTSA